MVVRRGEVWWAELGDPVGSEPGFRRPVLVIQANAYNASKLATVVVVAITSNLALADAPGNCRLRKADSGLPKPSVVNVSQVVTLDRQRLVRRVRALPAQVIQDVNNGLRQCLSL